jgi:HEAT repeat protein
LVESALSDAIAEHASFDTLVGVEVIFAKAAMDSLAAVAGDNAVSPIAVVLDHPSRDLRVSAARALAKTASANAIPPLQTRLQTETDNLVSLALQRALSALEGG